MLKNISHYGLATIITMTISLLAIPFFTRYLTPQDFGVLALYLMFGGVTTSFLSISLFAASSRYYYKEKNNIEYFASLNFTNLCFILFMFGIGGLLVWQYADAISFHLFDGGISREIVLWSYVGGCFANIFGYLSSLLLAQQRSLAFSLIKILSIIISVFLAMIIILNTSLTYYARIFSWIISHVILIVILFYLQRHYILPRWSNSALKRSLVFSYPQIPGKMIGMLHEGVDKVMLTNIRGLATVGHYQIAQRLGEVNKMMNNTVNQAWTPFFMHKSELKTDQAKREIVERYQEVVMFFNYSSILMCCFAEEAIRLLTTEAFYPSMFIVPLVVMYILIDYSLTAIAKPQILFAEKLLYALPASFASLAVNIVFNIFLIPLYGAVGAALATAAAGLTSSTILFYYANKLYPLPIYYGRLIGQLILFITFMVPIYGLMLVEMPLYTKLSLKLMLLGIYFITTIKLGFVSFHRIKTTINRIRLLAGKNNQ
jgi:O-antigen/teichoic acid export membrane protein